MKQNEQSVLMPYFQPDQTPGGLQLLLHNCTWKNLEHRRQGLVGGRFRTLSDELGRAHSAKMWQPGGVTERRNSEEDDLDERRTGL